MIAAIINAIGIVIGGTLGTVFRGRINDRFTNTLMAAMGVVCSKRLLNQMIWKSLRTHNFTYRRKETKP